MISSQDITGTADCIAATLAASLNPLFAGLTDCEVARISGCCTCCTACMCSAAPHHLCRSCKHASQQQKTDVRYLQSVSAKSSIKLIVLADPCQRSMPTPCGTHSSCLLMCTSIPDTQILCMSMCEPEPESTYLLKAFLHNSSSSSVNFTAIVAAAFPLHELRAAPPKIN
jgi:hypothetical protein